MLTIRRPAAVIFDCDGLLVETESRWELAQQRMFAKNGLEFTSELRKPMLGTSPRDTSALMAQLFPGSQSAAALEQELLDMVQALIEEQACAMPGTVDMIELLSERGVPYAVASNSPRRVVDATLITAGLDRYFDVRVTTEDVVHPKPAPDLYLTACERLGVRPATAIAFEDSVVGVTSAQAAGMKVIGIPTLDIADFRADWVVSSMDNSDLLNQVRNW